jgi:DNA-3-methyladenine glycosylase I
MITRPSRKASIPHAQALARCPWPTAGDPLYLAYHDQEWGVPIRDDRKIFEFLVLEAFQAGLSWRTILYKRENFRKAFAGFDYRKVARFGRREVARLLNDEGIVRNRQKIDAAITNAQRFLEVREEHGTFAAYMWSWVNGKPIVHHFRTLKDYPPYIDEAVAWAKDLKRRGFKFLGPTVVYAHMQAVGMVNDHTVDCFRRSRAGNDRIP